MFLYLYACTSTLGRRNGESPRFDIFGDVKHRTRSVNRYISLSGLALIMWPYATGNEGDITVASPRRTGPRVSISSTWKGRGSATSVLGSRIVCRGQIDSASAPTFRRISVPMTLLLLKVSRYFVPVRRVSATSRGGPIVSVRKLCWLTTRWENGRREEPRERSMCDNVRIASPHLIAGGWLVGWLVRVSSSRIIQITGPANSGETN